MGSEWHMNLGLHQTRKEYILNRSWFDGRGEPLSMIVNPIRERWVILWYYTHALESR